jgi:hypothetical protein
VCLLTAEIAPKETAELLLHRENEVTTVKVKLPARLLATQLLSAHKQFLSPNECAPNCRCRHFTEEQRQLAIEMLTTHIEACRRLGTPGSLKAAATDTLFMASLNERAYEPIPARSAFSSSSLASSQGDAWGEDIN